MSWYMPTSSSNAAHRPASRGRRAPCRRVAGPPPAPSTRVRRLGSPWRARQPPSGVMRSAVGRAAAGLAREVPQGARLAVEVREELDAAMGSDERGHPLDVRRIVDSPQAPFADRVPLAGMRRVELVVRLPRRLEALVVEIVRDDVDVRVSRVVRGSRVRRDVRRPVALRVPDDARLRPREVASERRTAELPQLRVQLGRRAAAREERDARERAPERGRRVPRAFRAAALRERAVLVPVAVHLRQRADVDALPEARQRAVEREQEPVAAPLGDIERGDDSARS